MTDFDTLIRIIEDNFKPESVHNEEEAEKELLDFLNSRFPNSIHARGHSSTGVKIDIVVEGTYAIELVTINNEGRLITLMNQIMESKEDFAHIAVILLDIGKIPSDIVKDYVNEYKKLGVRTVVKQTY